MIRPVSAGACSAAARPPRPAGRPAASRRRPTMPKPANWLCLPGRSDVCSTPLPTTALNPNGYGSTGRSPVAKNPPVDCFYVYPTVSRDRGLNSDLTPDAPRSRRPPQSQFARFAGVCRTFAPIYRQMTLGAVAAAATGARRHRAGDARLSRRRRRLAHLSRQPQQGPPVRPDRPQPGHRLMLQRADRAARSRASRSRRADAARDHPRLQRAGAAGQARRRHLQVDAAVQPRRPRPAA